MAEAAGVLLLLLLLLPLPEDLASAAVAFEALSLASASLEPSSSFKALVASASSSLFFGGSSFRLAGVVEKAARDDDDAVVARVGWRSESGVRGILLGAVEYAHAEEHKDGTGCAVCLEVVYNRCEDWIAVRHRLFNIIQTRSA